MILELGQATNKETPAAAILEHAKRLSEEENTIIYVFWCSINRSYSLSDCKTIFAPIISGGYTPSIVAIYEKGNVKKEDDVSAEDRDIELRAYRKYVAKYQRGTTLGTITQKFNEWWGTLSKKEKIDYAGK